MRPKSLSRWCGILVLLPLLAVPAAGGEDAQSDALWVSRGTAALRDPAARVRTSSTASRLVALEREAMDGILEGAPTTGDPGPVSPGVLITLPHPDGRLLTFRAVEDPILTPEVSAENPDLRTYVLTSDEIPGTWGRMTWTLTGLHAYITDEGGTWCVEPVWVGDPVTHAAFLRRDAERPIADVVACGVEAGRSTALRAPGGPQALASPPTGGTIHTYDFAPTTTTAYTTWAFGNQGMIGTPTAAALTELTILVNASNVVLQRDVGVRLTIVTDTGMDLLYDGTPVEPYAPASGSVLAAIHADIAAKFAADALTFDVGHCFDNNNLNRGRAGGDACNAANAGAAYTSSNLGNPNTFNFRVLFLHELGHQFSAGHTFDSDTQSPGDFAPATAWEPGNGITIMSYGVSTYEDYYHAGSINEIVTFVNTNGCEAEAATGNAPPVANAGPDFTIPKQTPFRLIGSATDADDAAGSLTYTWEELDATPAQVNNLDLDNGVIPLFRTLTPANSLSTRYCPRLSVLQANSKFPATTTPGQVFEQLPIVARTDGFMDWTLTVRDNRAGSATMIGGMDADDMRIIVEPASGPFWVTAPNGGESWEEGTVQTVTWSVNGTDGGTVAALNVRISMSTDGGATFPIELLASTLNDGSADVTLPVCGVTTQARIMVEAIGNIFFDISDTNFSIVDLTPPVVTCTVGRQVLWPASNGLLDILLTHSALDNCSVPTVSVLRVHSDEPNGAAPYTPDATIVGPTWRLRAQRAIPGDGRVYLCVVEYVDASLVPARDVCTAVVPAQLTVSSISAVLLDASVQRANCIGAGGAPPAGFVQLVSVP